MMTRHVLEGEWSGYVERQRRVVHREVMTDKRFKSFKLTAIQYTDGTTLNIRVREANPRERIETINSYGSLIRECEGLGKSFVRVADLPTTKVAS